MKRLLFCLGLLLVLIRPAISSASEANRTIPGFSVLPGLQHLPNYSQTEKPLCEEILLYIEDNDVTDSDKDNLSIGKATFNTCFTFSWDVFDQLPEHIFQSTGNGRPLTTRFISLRVFRI